MSFRKTANDPPPSAFGGVAIRVSQTPRNKQKDVSLAQSAPVYGTHDIKPPTPRIRPRAAPSNGVPDFFLPPSPPVHITRHDSVSQPISRSLSSSYTSQRADFAAFQALSASSGSISINYPGQEGQFKSAGDCIASSPTIMSVLQTPGSLSGLPRYPTNRFSQPASSSRNPSSLFAAALHTDRRESDLDHSADLPSPHRSHSASPPLGSPRDDELQFPISFGGDIDRDLASQLDKLDMLDL